HEIGEFCLPVGSTVGDLLRTAHADAENMEVLVNGVRMQDLVVITNGATIRLTPRTEVGSNPRSWEQSVGQFRDDAGFDEFVESVRLHRNSELAESSDA